MISRTEYPWDFFLNTIHILLSIDTFDEWVPILDNGHMKTCHHTFTFLMTGSTNSLKKWVGECSSFSTRRCQNYFVRQNCISSSYTRATSGESHGLGAVCICSQLQSSEGSTNLASPCETQNWSWRPSFWEAQQSLYIYIVFDHFWEANWYLY